MLIIKKKKKRNSPNNHSGVPAKLCVKEALASRAARFLDLRGGGILTFVPSHLPRVPAGFLLTDAWGTVLEESSPQVLVKREHNNK